MRALHQYPPGRHKAIAALAVLALVRCVLGGAQTITKGSLSPFVPIQAESLGATSVDSLLQSADGHLWITSGRNLLRFDGQTTVRFNPSNTPGMQIDEFVFNALVQDKDGDIWVGTNSAGVVRVHAGEFETFGTREGLPDGRVNRVDLDANGRVWIYTPKGAARFEHGRIRATSVGEDLIPLLTDPQVIGYDGRLQGYWRRTASGMKIFSHGQWKVFPLPIVNGHKAKLEIRSIYEDRKQRVWFSLLHRRGQYYCFDHGQLLKYEGLPPDSFVSYRDREGYLWLNDHKGRAALWKDGMTTPLPNFHSTNLLHVLERPDGGFWAGTISSALFELRPRRFTLLPTPGAPDLSPVFFRDSRRQIWVGDVLLQRWNGEKLAIVPTSSDSRPGSQFDDQTCAFTEDAQGRLMMAKYYFIELSNQRGKPDPRFAGVRARMRSLVTASDGTIWIGTSQGLYRYGGKPAHIVLEEGLPSNRVQTLQIDRQGRLWVGTSSGAVLYGGSGSQASILAKFGDRAVRAFAEDDGGMWLASTDGKILRIEHDRFIRSYGTEEGLLHEELGDIRADDPGYLWLSYETQLVRIETSSLAKNSARTPVTFQTFNRFDGVPSDLAFGSLRHLRLDDGTLWFSSGGGILSFRPSSLSGYLDQPRATIEEVLVDGLRGKDAPEVRLNANYESLRVAFGAPGVTQPEKVLFRYRLRGYDPEWSKADFSREVFYSHLPAGTYTMEVQASGTTSSDWRSTTATKSIVVEARWFARKLTKFLVALVGLSLLTFMLIRRRRLRIQDLALRRAYTRRLTESQELERKRIAGALHDSLGQQLVIIRSMAMRTQENESGKEAQLEAISKQAVEAIHELEAISYSLRPYQLDRLGLTKALDSLIRTYGVDTGITVLHHVEDVDACLPKSSQIDLYRIVQEAMNNALRHSRAMEIQIRIWPDSGILHGLIVDNGVGFTRSDLVRQGLGLAGIEERAESAGGTAEIVSSPGSGTRIIIRIELRKGSQRR